MTTDTFVDEWLPRCSSEEVRVFLFTTRLEGIGRPRRMSYAEMGARAGVAPQLVHPALLALADKGIIDYQKRRLRIVTGSTTIQLQMQDARDDLADLIEENRQLHTQVADVGTYSGLAEKLHAEQGNAVRVAEETLGRGLEIQEAYYLGDLITSFGPERVIKAIGASRTQKNPLRAAYARLKRGAHGKSAADKKETAGEPISYGVYDGSQAL